MEAALYSRSLRVPTCGERYANPRGERYANPCSDVCLSPRGGGGGGGGVGFAGIYGDRS